MRKLSNWTDVNFSRSSPVRCQEEWAVQAMSTTITAMANPNATNRIFIAPLDAEEAIMPQPTDGRVANESAEGKGYAGDWKNEVEDKDEQMATRGPRHYRIYRSAPK